MKPFILILGGLVLLVATGFQVHANFFSQPEIHFADYTDPEALFEVLPESLAVEDIPIAETESQLQAVEDILRPTAMTYKKVASGGEEIFVWIATWAPREMSPWEVFGHTPDTCWIGSGAELVARNDPTPFRIYPELLNQAQRRTFEMAQGQNVEVLWWHLLGGEPVAARETGAKNMNPVARLQSFFDFQLEFSHSEQVFIRIHSAGNMEEILANPDFKPLIEQIQSLFAQPPVAEA